MTPAGPAADRPPGSPPHPSRHPAPPPLPPPAPAPPPRSSPDHRAARPPRGPLRRAAAALAGPRYAALALAGTAGTLLIAAGGSLTTPLTGKLVPAGQAAAGDAAFLLGVGFLVAAWAALVRARPTAATAVAAAVVWSIPLLVAPPLASRDVHSYAAQGEIVARGLDPYADPPRALGRGEFLDRVDPLWRGTAAPYGPGWLAAGGGVARLAGGDQQRAVTGFRVLALAGVVALGAATAALGGDRGTALALTVANPLTLLHVVSGAHNEAWLVALAVAGFGLAVRRRPDGAARPWRLAAGVVLLGLAAAVKAPALALLPFAGWHAATAHRFRAAVLATLGGLATLAAVTAATGLGWGWVPLLGTPGTVRTALAPVTGLGVTLGSVAGAIGLAEPSTVLGLVRGAGSVATLAAVAYLLFRGGRLGPLAAAGAAMLAVGLLNPAVHVWYVLWAAPLLATEEEHAGPLLRLCGVLAFVILPDGSSVLSWLRPVRYVAGAAVVAVAVAPLCRTIVRRATTGTSSADREPQRAGDGGSPVARPA